MEQKKDAITGDIGLFSGRPNPELSLTGEAIEKFASLVKAAIGKEPIHAPPVARLGYYYGFKIHVPKELAKAFELPAEFKVYHSVITERKNREQKHWRDVSNVEKFLIDEAYKQDYGDLLEKVGLTKPE